MVKIEWIITDSIKDVELKEFDTEIQVIDEKISDARSAGKRREKYHLMRLKNKLESERTRVRYGLRE